jgi:hypothetical protein
MVGGAPCYSRFVAKRLAKTGGAYSTNERIARRVYRAFKTPADTDRTTDPILGFHFRGRDDYIMLRCNKEPEISIKGKGQTAGEVKFFAYSDFKDCSPQDVLFKLRDDLTQIELYARGAIEKMTWGSWDAFSEWLDSLREEGVQISLKLPSLVYAAVRHQPPSMQNFIVEAIKLALKHTPPES